MRCTTAGPAGASHLGPHVVVHFAAIAPAGLDGLALAPGHQPRQAAGTAALGDGAQPVAASLFAAVFFYPTRSGKVGHR